MRLAAASYQPQWHANWDSVVAKQEAWVADAARQGADLLVFPEYSGIEAALIGQPDSNGDPVRWRDAMVDKADAWIDLYSGLSRRHNVVILAGSLNARTPAGIVNRAALCSPAGDVGCQDKLIPTPYERGPMGLVSGAGLQVFDTSLGRIGVLICYDSEFPLLARALVAEGAEIILVPSCTEQLAGQTRVCQSARARAIEGQCLVVQAPLVGRVQGCDIADTNTGAAGLFCPPDYGLPADGIIAQGRTDEVGWTIAPVEMAQIATVRKNGQVGNVAHWPEQENHIKTVASVKLR